MKCKRCGHLYEEHATDLSHEKEKCWHGAVVGNTCECPEYQGEK
jgi:hypothetical protein